MAITLSGTGVVTGLASGGLPDGTITSAELASGAAKANFGAGTVLQVNSTTKVTMWSASGSGGWYDVSGLSVTITPSSTSSKVLVSANIFGGLSDFNNFNYYWRFMRDSTPISVGTEGTQVNVTGGHNMYINGGSVPFAGSMAGTYLDSPSSTSTITYKIQVSPWDANGTIYVNRRGSGNNNGGTSTITVMEIAG